MNGFLDQPFVWDLLFLLIFLLCIALSAKRGGFEAISGIAGTALGVIVGRKFQLPLAVKLQPLLEPKLLALAQKTDLTQVGGLQEGSALTELIQQSTAVTDKVSELYTSLIAAIAKQLSENLASILAFLLLFFAVKLARPAGLPAAKAGYPHPQRPEPHCRRHSGRSLRAAADPGSLLGCHAVCAGGRPEPAEPGLPAGEPDRRIFYPAVLICI